LVDEFEIYSIPGFSDPVSCWTHLLGAGVFAVLAIFLLRRGWGSWGRVFVLGVFTFGCVFLLSMSGVFHLLSRGSAGRAVLQRLDHAAIFFLIAATFTPVHGILFRGLLRWAPLFLIWSATITGITLKTIFFRDLSEELGLVLYLGLGWLGLFSGGLLWYWYGLRFIQPVIRGALAYTVGAVLEFLRWPVLIPGVVGPHELFHLAVLAGIGFFWQFIHRTVAIDMPELNRSSSRRLDWPEDSMPAQDLQGTVQG
jgi:channel protein (hemolysin III family)